MVGLGDPDQLRDPIVGASEADRQRPDHEVIVVQEGFQPDVVRGLGGEEVGDVLLRQVSGGLKVHSENITREWLVDESRLPIGVQQMARVVSMLMRRGTSSPANLGIERRAHHGHGPSHFPRGAAPNSEAVGGARRSRRMQDLMPPLAMGNPVEIPRSR